MSVKTTPGYRWTGRRVRFSYAGLDAMAQPTAVIEPETIGAREWNSVDINTIVSTAPVGVKGVINTVAQTLDAQTTAVLSALATAPAGTTEDQQVLVGQTNPKILYYAYISIENNSLGVPTPYVRVRGYNVTTATASVYSAGDLVPAFQKTIPYAIVRHPAPTQPTTPNAPLAITPGKRWLTPNEAITAQKLNLTAAPLAQVVDGSIGKVEINSRDLLAVMAAHIGKRSSFTVAGSTPVPGGSSAWTTLGTKAVTGVTTSDIVVVAQPGSPTPRYGGYVGTNGIVTLTARHNGLGTITIPASTMLHFIVF